MGAKNKFWRVYRTCNKIHIVRAFVVAGLLFACLSTLVCVGTILARMLCIGNAVATRWHGLVVALFACLSAVCISVPFGVCPSCHGWRRGLLEINVKVCRQRRVNKDSI